MIDILSKVLPGIVGDVIKRALPGEKMSEEKKLKIELETAKVLQEVAAKEIELDVKDRSNARNLAKRDLKDGNAFTNFLAAFHRPLWSIATLVIFCWSIIGPSLGLPTVELTGIHQAIMMSVIVFYFGGRSLEKIFKTIKKGN